MVTHGAFYIKKDSQEKKTANPAAVQKTGNLLSQACKDAKDKITDFDIQSVAKNITLQSASEFTQKYAVGALTTLINGQPVTNQTMLDALFNGLAPAMNLTAFQSGFNSISQMKIAVNSGNINVPNFLQGFQNGLSLIQESTENVDYSMYGDEIVIDLTMEVNIKNVSETPDRRVENGQIFSEYIHNLPKLIDITGKTKENHNHTSDELVELLEHVRFSKKPFTFRAGKKIYENYVFTNLEAKKAGGNGIDIIAEIKKFDSGSIELVKVDIPRKSTTSGKKRIQNVNQVKTQAIKNATQPKNYAGVVGAVESIIGIEGRSTIYLDSLFKRAGEYKP